MKIISRKEAKELGLKKYFTGKPCKRGHIAERFVSAGRCVECANIHSKKWRQENRELFLEFRKSWYQDNREKHLDQFKKRYQDNREEYRDRYKIYYQNNHEKVLERNKQWRQDKKIHCSEYAQDWRQKNPHKVALGNERRTQYLKERTPSWYSSEEDLIKTIYQKRDELSELWNTKLHVDHIIPIIHPLVCGLHCYANLQLLEASINNSKYNSYDVTLTW